MENKINDAFIKILKNIKDKWHKILKWLGQMSDKYQYICLEIK